MEDRKARVTSRDKENMMRKFRPQREDDQQNLILVKQLRINKPLGIYARRSDPTAKDAKKDRTQSREMQTDDMIKWGKRSGWIENLIHPYFADLGLSGTLRPDQRPDMLRLFDDIDSGKFDGGTLACWQENRPFRDETHIYYNQLIDKMLQHDIVMVVLSPRLYIYDMRDPFDKERLREKFKEAADFIPKHIKGWLQPARERAAWEDDEWAGMGDLPPGFICDYDPQSLTYKHAIPYWPHIEKVEEHFKLYMDLAGEISLFYQHLKVSPIVFPEFCPEIDRRIVSRFKLSKYPGGGYYIKSRTSLVSMLTNPMYWGYRAIKGVIRRDQDGNKIRSFEPVIAKELREFAFYRLSKTDFDGNPLESNVLRRYFRDEDAEFGLLKFRIYSDQGGVYTHRKYSSGAYHIQTLEDAYLHNFVCHAEVLCEDLDNLVVKRLFERVEVLSQKREKVEMYEASAAVVRNARLTKINQINKSISDIDKNQGGLTRNLGKVEMELAEIEMRLEESNEKGLEEKKELKERRKQLIEDEIEKLEIERKELIKTRQTLEEEISEDIGSLDEELVKLKEGWSSYSFKKRRSLINFAVREVRINKMSNSWMEVQILWLHEEWGHERMYYRRPIGAKKFWTEEEIKILEENYGKVSISELMALLPARTLQSILGGYHRFLKTNKEWNGERVKIDKELGISLNKSHSDIEFERSRCITDNVSYTNWEALY
jgi:hypothetical protein